MMVVDFFGVLAMGIRGYSHPAISLLNTSYSGDDSETVEVTNAALVGKQWAYISVFLKVDGVSGANAYAAAGLDFYQALGPDVVIGTQVRKVSGQEIPDPSANLNGSDHYRHIFVPVRADKIIFDIRTEHATGVHVSIRLNATFDSFETAP